ncbi:hypothetical protein Pint_27128 [Pistacia integerrima]|uniref:Uncharacterized protein n=1 Tax=Pistacia integerrima TaxID=434235 RepID=A0ACC0YQL4_9ROSI|nr:hypothetical protein Pint_27128 [Pistacia integerrima]
MERELLSLCESTKKAALAAAMDSVSFTGPEVSRCIDLLKRLKDFPVTGKVLVSTAVDKQLRHLRQHKKEKIRSMAKWLLEIWSKKIKEYSSRNRGENSYVDSSKKTQRVGSTNSTIHHQYSSRNNVKDAKCETGFKKLEKTGFKMQTSSRKFEEIEKRTCEGEIGSRKVEEAEKKPLKFILKIKIKPSKEPCKYCEEEQKASIKCNNASRDKVREILLEALRKVAGEVDEETKKRLKACDPVGVAVSTETEMFKKMGLYNGANKLKYRSIMFNIKDPNNPDLRRKILLGEVKPERLINMSVEEMASDKRQCEIRKIKEKAALREQMGEEISEDKPDFDEVKWLESLWPDNCCNFDISFRSYISCTGTIPGSMIAAAGTSVGATAESSVSQQGTSVSAGFVHIFRAAMISRYVEKRNMDVALELFFPYEAAGEKPDLVTVLSLTSGFGHSGKLY